MTCIRPLLLGWLHLFLLAALSCTQSKKIVISSAEPLTLSVVDPKNGRPTGDILGRTPYESASDKLLGKMLRIEGKDKQAQTFVFVPTGDHLLRLNLDLPDEKKLNDSAKLVVSESREPSSRDHMNRDDVNHMMRLLMASYQALSRGELKACRNVADEAAKQYPGIAAPFILKALAALKEGQKAEAKQLFLQARTHDPGDENIARALKAIE